VLVLAEVIINNFHVNTMATIWYLVLITYEIKKLFRTNVSAHSLFLTHKTRYLHDWVFHSVIFSHIVQTKSKGWPCLFCWGTFSRVKEPGPEIDYSPPSSTKVTNTWNYTCTSSCVLKACTWTALPFTKQFQQNKTIRHFLLSFCSNIIEYIFVKY
jgi:hypothetical protein